MKRRAGVLAVAAALFMLAGCGEQAPAAPSPISTPVSEDDTALEEQGAPLHSKLDEVVEGPGALDGRSGDNNPQGATGGDG